MDQETVELESESETGLDKAVHGMEPNDGKLPKEVTGSVGQTGLAWQVEFSTKLEAKSMACWRQLS